MIKMLSSTVSILAEWILLLVCIPILSWIIMIVTVLIVKHHVETLPYTNSFSIWLSSLITAYGFCLYNLLRNKSVSIRNNRS
jgi:hypothetical protein